VYVVSEIRRRRYRGKTPPAISKPEHVYRLVFPRLKDEKREHFVALYLSARNTVIAQETVSVGSLNASIVHPREVYRPAILHSAAALILAHNHPSGDPTPSEEDVAITKRLHEAGQLLGIELLDHVVLASDGFTSMRERHSLR
jgi:DNA repair protein RadC